MAIIPEATLTNPVVSIWCPTLDTYDTAVRDKLEGIWAIDRGLHSFQGPDFTINLIDLAKNANTLNTFYTPTYEIESDNSGLIPGPFINNLYGCYETILNTMFGHRNGNKDKFYGLPSTTLINATASIISTPYFTDGTETINGVTQNNMDFWPEAPRPIYVWKAVQAPDFLENADRWWLRGNKGGYVFVETPSSKEKVPTIISLTIDLPLNSFCLDFEIQSGSDTDDMVDITTFAQQGVQRTDIDDVAWEIKLEFGEVKVIINEKYDKIKIKIGDQNETELLCTPTVKRGSKDSTKFSIAFIQVWNGILVSDSVQGNSFGSFVYVQKDPKIQLADIVKKKLEKDKKEDPPRWGKIGDGLPVGPSFGMYGVEIEPEASTLVTFGNKLTVSYLRCGSLIKFKPILFAESFIVHYLTADETSKGKYTGNPISLNEIFTNSPKPCAWTVPVYYLNGHTTEIIPDDYTHRNTGVYCVTPDVDSYSFMVKVKEKEPALKRPIEFWGFEVYSVEDPDNANCPCEVFRTAEGCLTDIQQPRIRSVNISRNLDSTSGSIKWDRYGPTGLINRPTQSVGALAIGVSGGVDTIPGTIFTGIGLGNAAEDSPESDTIEVPLHGREIKMTEAGGGIRLINSPFFDGYDHFKVIQYLCNYAGVPCASTAANWKLPSGNPCINSLVNFKTGTPVWDAISEVQKLAMTVAYFDRNGVLQYRDVGVYNQVNWTYPLSKVKSYNEKPDVTTVYNKVVVAAIVREGTPQRSMILNPFSSDAEIGKAEAIHNGSPDSQVPFYLNTVPAFPWDKCIFYVLPGVVERADLNREFKRICKAVKRPRATGSVSIPGNALVELWDTFNTYWIVTGISQAIDLDAKTWTTSLTLEYIVDIGRPPAGPNS